LLLCYSLAMPFYARSLIGDMVFGYGYLLVTTYTTIQNKTKLFLSKITLTFFPS